MTSNLAASEIQDYNARMAGVLGRLRFPRRKSDKEGVKDIVMGKMLKAFSPEFVNRIDNVIVFNWIEDESVQKIVSIEIKRLNNRLRKHNCYVEVSESVVSHIIKNGFDKQFGARSLKRSIRKNLEVPLAEFLMSQHKPSETFDVVRYNAKIVGRDVVFERGVSNG